MKFTTPVTIPQYAKLLTHQLNILSFGSCFADRIGNKLKAAGFHSITNPLGISYNPISIKKLLTYCINNASLDSTGYLMHNDIVSHFDLHSQHNQLNTNILKTSTTEIISSIHDYLHNTDLLILTLGSAIVYKHKTLDTIVNNCHKVAQDQFEKVLLSVDEVVENYNTLFATLRKVNPTMQIILTVSPVRHLRHGAIMNNRSKARLLLICEQLEQSHSYAHYFPAYELMIDELRDYRFMADDMVHPSSQATEYIWDTFVESFCDDETKQIIKEVNAISKLKHHRPFFPESSQAEAFEQKVASTIKAFEAKYPDITLNT